MTPIRILIVDDQLLFRETYRSNSKVDPAIIQIIEQRDARVLLLLVHSPRQPLLLGNVFF